MIDWITAKRCLQRADEYLEAAETCLYGPPGERKTQLIRGKGAPSPRIIGMSGTWVWGWPFPLWLEEQAARYIKRAAAARRTAARRDRDRRCLRRTRW